MVTPSASVEWPRLKTKKGLEIQEVLPDQIYVIDVSYALRPPMRLR